ncbi:LysR family transcriptional regulator [Serratia ficaria]|uniref:LysR family transcriptional regulator n=1 Tax=Serratia TaxID=613 RepID=UPI00077C25DC|nr:MULTISPECIES: LysR family transcriptional regulator [Serratia]MEE4482147.1 LysR family transcriptional regulator [Serratia ficaria]CAI0708095.1 HTH-type transcriptional regulator AbgR [Serratia ficaria]CAI1754127.1 HTH-type transcriptional regulator AbgR [Serratia ficaria]CAI1841966.1 HTH-type transcriptional regulator AbgR [Serratia ficaria]CAI2111205.1 HTH-type transcriptional regulator AbgR [Serratia ficaria]
MIVDKILRQFIEVAMFKNVSHAANKLCLSQPTLTHNMKKLEETLGVQLLERTSTGVNTTEYGDLLLEQAQMMQRIYDNTLLKLAFIKARQEQSLRMGTGHAWWYMFVRDSFNAYRRLHPTVNIHIDLGNHLRLMDLLLGGDIDLFIGHEIQGLNPKAGISFLPLFGTTDSMFVRRGHPLLDRVVTPDALLDYPCVELTPDETRYQHMVEDMQPKRLARNRLHLAERVICSTNSMMSAVDMVNDSDAVMLAYPSCMAGYFADYGIVPLQMNQESPRCTVGIYLMREKADAPHVVQMQELMRQHLEQIRPLLR